MKPLEERIIEIRSKGHSYRATAEILNKEGYTTSHGKAWSAAALISRDYYKRNPGRMK